MRKITWNQIWTFICIIVLFVTFCTFSANAAEHDIKITILYQYDETAIPDAEFRIYRVGEIDAVGDMKLTGVFAEYPVDVNFETSDEMQMASDALYGYIVMDQIEPDLSAITNVDGYVDYTGLESGLYLVAGQTCTISGVTYLSQPQLLAIPEDGEKHIKLNIKCLALPESGTTTSLKVLKDWADEGHAKERPKMIRVSLLKDGSVFDTVTLDKGSRWRYIWKNLDANAQWMVAEEPIDSYTVSVRKEGNVFLVVNTYDETEPEEPSKPSEEEPTKPSDEPEDDEPNEPGTTAPTEPSSEIPTEPDTEWPTDHIEDEPEEESSLSVLGEEEDFTMSLLPQTGMNWWPAMICACSGMVLLFVGLLIGRRDRDE